MRIKVFLNSLEKDGCNTSVYVPIPLKSGIASFYYECIEDEKTYFFYRFKAVQLKNGLHVIECGVLPQFEYKNFGKNLFFNTLKKINPKNENVFLMELDRIGEFVLSTKQEILENRVVNSLEWEFEDRTEFHYSESFLVLLGKDWETVVDKNYQKIIDLYDYFETSYQKEREVQ